MAEVINIPQDQSEYGDLYNCIYLYTLLNRPRRCTSIQNSQAITTQKIRNPIYGQTHFATW